MPARSGREDLAQQASFIFKGTVHKLKAAAMAEVPVTDRTVVVRVDEIIQAPEVFTDYAGQLITVQLGGRKSVKKGDQAIFYTNGWIFGEGLAVQSLGQQVLKKTAAAGLARAAGGDPAENLANQDTQARFASADIVASGRVISVRLPPEMAGARRAAAGSTAETTLGKPISEHDPLIREAVIAVDAVHKGSYSDKEAVVRFPSSTDVRWYQSPKFRPGDEGFFMLHKAGTEKAARGRARGAGPVAALVAEGEAEGVFTALHPADFQPFDRPGGLRNIITLPGGSATPPEE